MAHGHVLADSGGSGSVEGMAAFAKLLDRYIVTQLEADGRTWTLTGVFHGECCSAGYLEMYSCCCRPSWRGYW